MARRAYSKEDMQEEITENMHGCDGTTLRVCELVIKCSTRAENFEGVACFQTCSGLDVMEIVDAGTTTSGLISR